MTVAMKILTWQHAKMLFKHTREMLWVFKAQLLRCGGDARPADEQLLSLTHDKAPDDVARRVVCHLP